MMKTSVLHFNIIQELHFQMQLTFNRITRFVIVFAVRLT